jgi:hypothetical protein
MLLCTETINRKRTQGYSYILRHTVSHRLVLKPGTYFLLMT